MHDLTDTCNQSKLTSCQGDDPRTNDLADARNSCTDVPHPAPDRARPPIQPGDRVVIFQPLDIASLPRLEGYATLIEPISHIPDLWRVRFKEELTSRLRFVHSDWQCDPDGMLAALTSHWRATVTPELLTEFSLLDLVRSKERQ